MKKDDIVGGVMLLVVILAVGAFLMFSKEAPELSYGPVEIAGSTLSASVADDAALTVFATVVKPGFVTLHESIGGAPGPIIGTSQLLTAGENMQVSVKLSKEMTEGLPYVLLLHIDNGDGTFVVTDDMPVTNGGVSVRADFVSKGVKKTM